MHRKACFAETTSRDLLVSETANILSDSDGRELLEIARRAAEAFLGGRDHPSLAGQGLADGSFGGAFVTFWSRKRLRGCVGSFRNTRDLGSLVQQVTVSALQDGRFVSDPIRAAELVKLTIEVSVLSDPVVTDDPLSLTPGVHGVIVRRGKSSGCFLPKVATDRGWDASQFLSNCCTMKADLAPDAWRECDTEVLLFDAVSFRDL
jgi:AmmeMemoRadiSam system protein A